MPIPPIDESLVGESSDSQERLLNHGTAEDLTGRAVRGGATVLAAQAVKFSIQFGGIAILSRLLGPADFGVVAMVTAFTGLAVVLKDVGLSQSTVQRTQITHGQISTLFWINVTVGILIFAFLCCIAPTITWFYGDSRLTTITIVSSCQFIFAGFSVQHLALLNRDMQFRKLALVEISSSMTGLLAGIAMAWKGYGYWSLVAMPLVTSITAAFAAMTLSSWRPSGPGYYHGLGDMLRMGGNLAGFSIVNYIARNLDNSLIGWRWGAESLGIYSRSYSLFTLPLSQINAPLSQVAVAGLSRTQNDSGRFASYYEKAATLSFSLTVPIVVFTLVAAPEIIDAVLGSQWRNCVSIFRYLAVSGIFQPISNSMGWIYISIGRSDRILRWGILCTVVYCVSFSIGLHFGSKGVAIAYTCAATLLFWPSLLFATRGTSIRPGRLLLTLCPPVISATASGLICVAAKMLFLESLNSLLALVTMATIMLAFYIALLFGIFNDRQVYVACLTLLLRKPVPPLSKA